MVERPLIFGPISLPVCLGCLKTLPLKKVLENIVSQEKWFVEIITRCYVRSVFCLQLWDINQTKRELFAKFIKRCYMLFVVPLHLCDSNQTKEIYLSRSSKGVLCSFWFVCSFEISIKQKRFICDDQQKVLCALCGWPMCSAECSQRSPHAQLECRLFRFLSWHKVVLMLISIFQLFLFTAKYSWEWMQKVLPSKRNLSWLTPAFLQSGLFFKIGWIVRLPLYFFPEPCCYATSTLRGGES